MLLALGEAVLLLTMHHIVSDGWSMGMLSRPGELLPPGSRAATHPPSPPIQYADYALWQRRWLAGERDRQLAFWREHLGGAPRAGAAHRPPPPAGAEPAGAPADRSLRPGPRRLERLARADGATWFMILLAALKACSTAARASAICGWACRWPTGGASRPRAVMGFFVNTQVLRHRGGQPRSFSDLLGGCGRRPLEAAPTRTCPSTTWSRSCGPSAARAATPCSR